MACAYLLGSLVRDIGESPSTEEGDGGRATGVGMGVGLSPSIERGEEGCGTGLADTTTGLALCGSGFLRS